MVSGAGSVRAPRRTGGGSRRAATGVVRRVLVGWMDIVRREFGVQHPWHPDGGDAVAASPERLAAMRTVVQWSTRPRAESDMAGVARSLGMSRRTLQRRLSSMGLTFNALVQRSRLALAAHLLTTTDEKVVDIAFEVGYSDHAHFTRAFRRWTGSPPCAYRRGVRRAGAAGAASSPRFVPVA